MEITVEEKLLAILLKDESKVQAVREQLFENNFLNPHTQSIYKTILEYVESSNGHAPTPAILKTLLTKKSPEMAELLHGIVDRVVALTTEPDLASHVGFYVREIQEAWQAHVMQLQMMDAIGKLKKKDIAGARDVLQREILLSKDRMVEGNLANDFMAVLDDLEYRNKNWRQFEATPMGFQSLDLNTHGHGKKELVVIVGGTGVGKSLVLGQIAVNVAKNRKKVLLITVENDKRSYMNRLYSNISQVPYWKFKTAQLDEDDKLKWASRMGKLPEDFHFQVVEFPEGCSARDIWFYMRGQREKFDYLVVDQITNMTPNDAGDIKPMSWMWFGQIALDLKRLASYAYDNEGIPILSAAQAAGGTVGKKELTTDDIAMAKIIAHHSHGVLFVTRDQDEYNMGASKWRDARVEVFPVFPEFKYWSISETPLGLGSNKEVDLSAHAPLDDEPKGEELTPAQAEELLAEPSMVDMGEAVPMDEELVTKVQELVKDVKIDLTAPLPPNGDDDGF